MSVTIAQSTQPSTWLQRLTGTEPRTVVRETSTTEITSHPGGGFSLRTALRNGGIGAAVAGALGGVSLLGKVALPIIGKVGSLAGLAKLATVGGALGIATAAIPLVAPRIRQSPAAKAALVGAGIGAAAGAVLPLMPIPIGAAIGAGVGLLVHHRRTHPGPDYAQYPGYRAYPGYVPVGTSPGDTGVPHGLVPVTPDYGMYGGTAMNPYAMGMPGYPAPGYVQPQAMASPYGPAYGPQHGYGMLPATAQQLQQQPMATPAVAPAPARASAKPAVRTKAKTFTDKAGNVRQVGTGTIIKAGRQAAAPVGAVPVGTAAPIGAAGLGYAADPYASLSPYGAMPQAGGVPGMGAMPGVGALPGMGALPQAQAGMASAMPPSGGIQPTAIPARPVA